MHRPLMAILVALFTPALALFGCAHSPREAAADTSAPSMAEPRVLESDIDLLTGTNWRGTLTYLDFSSGKSTAIPSTLLLQKRPATPDGPCWAMAVGYTDEPHADTAEDLILRDGGRMLGGERVIARVLLSDGSIRFVTEEAGQDDGRDATFRRVYTLAPRAVTIQKLVKIQDATEFFERHAYAWTR